MSTTTKRVQRFIKTMHKEAKDSPGKTLGATLADTAIGGFAGVIAAPWLGDYGKWSGLALTLAGHFTGTPMLQTAGIGMLVGGIMAPQTAIPQGDLTDLSHQADRAKDRFNLAVGKAKAAFSPTSKSGATQNFDPAFEVPIEGLGNTQSLQQIEAELVRSALEYQAGQQANAQATQGYAGYGQQAMQQEAQLFETADADFEELTATM